MAEVRSKAAGSKFTGAFKWGGCWFTVRAGSMGVHTGTHGRVVTFGSRAAARAAAFKVAARYASTRAV